MLIIIGTNRENSNSRRIAEYYQQKLLEVGQASELLDLRSMPSEVMDKALYANSGNYGPFNEFFQAKVDATEKMIFIVPEYNGSFPGVLKIFIDCLKYPSSFRGKKAALVGLSSGTQGSALALSHLNDILSYQGTNVLAQRVRLPLIDSLLRSELDSNETYKKLFDLQIKLFLEF